MVTVTVDDEPALASYDLTAIGNASGLLWRHGAEIIAGVGTATRLPIERPGGASEAQAALTEFAVGQPLVALAALPFDREAPGELVVPEVTLRARPGQPTTVTTVGCSVADAFERIDALLARPSGPDVTSISVTAPVAPESWRDDVVGAARSMIRSGEATKVVLARELVATADRPFDLAAILRSLQARFAAAAVFAVDGFIGATPEVLVAREGERVHAHPLAGTAPRSSDPAEDAVLAADLATSTKNNFEHRITIEWLLDNLLPFCSYVDAEPEPSIMTLPNLHHLGTQVEGRLSSPAASVLELVAALHPTPAVGGAPQDRALRAIGEHEPGDRGRYAGPVGWVDTQGNGVFAVAIRSGTFEGDTASIWAGVGVVGDSDLQAELDETRTKFEAMLGSVIRP